MKPTSLALALTFTLALLATPGAARGEIFCVTSSFGLQAALNMAASNSADDIINVRTGTYEAPRGGFTYLESASDHGSRLQILGGWTGTRGEPCQSWSLDPAQTILDGNGQGRALSLKVGEESRVSVRYLTFLEGFAEGDGACGGGLFVTHLEYTGDGEYPHSAHVDVTHNWFLANEAGLGGGLCATWSREIEVVNNVFAGNHARILGGAMNLQNGHPSDGKSWASIDVANNTVVNNTSELSYTGGISVPTGDYALFANNIVWGSSNRDIELGFLGAPADRLDAHLLHNNFQILSLGSSNVYKLTDEGNIRSIPPKFEPGWFSYTPVATSPLIDAGVHPDSTFEFPLFYLEFYGNLRIVNDRVDIGAVEVQPSR